MGAGERGKVGQASHIPILVQYLTDNARRLEPGQARQVYPGLRVPGPGQNATGLGHDRHAR